MAKKLDQPDNIDPISDEMEDMLYAAHAEVKSAEDLQTQRGTPIPALFSQFFKFIQNPSTVSVETFKRMIDTDDTIGSGVEFLTTCLTARLGRYEHPNKEVAEFVNKALERVDGSWYSAIKELMSATWSGFAVQEKVWENTDEGFFIKKLVALPPSTILFETERTGELTDDGILQYQRNYNPQMMGHGLGFFGTNLGMSNGFNGGVRPDAYAKLGDFAYPLRIGNTFNYLSIRIPRQKCVHYAFDAQGKFGNPYGRSLLRRAYKYYVLKDAFLQMMSIALDRKGTPLTIVYVDPNTTLLDSKNYQAGKNPGQQGKVRADIAAAKAFENVHADSVIFLPGKKGQMFDVDVIPQAANVQDFISALDFCNKSILRALLIPTLIFGNGDGTGSFALGQEHAKTFDKILDGWLASVKQTLLQQVVKELIAYNFPREKWEKDGLGSFSSRDLSKDEVDKEMEVFEKGINAGIIDNNDLNDLNKMRETIGFEAKTELPIRENPLQMGGLDDGEEVDGEEEEMEVDDVKQKNE